MKEERGEGRGEGKEGAILSVLWKSLCDICVYIRRTTMLNESKPNHSKSYNTTII